MPSQDWLTYKTVLFMMQRLREAMSTINLAAMRGEAAKCKPMNLPRQHVRTFQVLSQGTSRVLSPPSFQKQQKSGHSKTCA